MSYFVYRNYTIEPLFSGLGASFSGYGDISDENEGVKTFIWFYLLPVKANTEDIIAVIQDYKQKLSVIVSIFPEDKRLVLFTLHDLNEFNWTLKDISLGKSIQ